MAIDTIVSFLSIAGFVGGGLMWYASQVQARTNRDRDLGHLKNSVQALSTNLSELTDELQSEHHDNKLELKEIKALVTSLSQRFEVILTRLEANSAIFGRRGN